MNLFRPSPQAPAFLPCFFVCWLLAAPVFAQRQASDAFGAEGYVIRASNEYTDHIWVDWKIEGEPRKLWRSSSPNGRHKQNLFEKRSCNSCREHRDYDKSLQRGAKYYYQLEYLPKGSDKTAKTEWAVGSLLVWATGIGSPIVWLDGDSDADKRPLRWSAVPGATGYLLEIAPARDSALWTAAGGFPRDAVDFFFLDTLPSASEALDWLPPAGFSGRVCATVKALGIGAAEFAPPLVFEASNMDLPVPIALNLAAKRPDAAGNWAAQFVFEHLGEADLSYALVEIFFSADRVLDPEDELLAVARDPEKDRLVAQRSLKGAVRQSAEGRYALDVQVYLPPAQPGKYYLIARIGDRHVASSERVEIR